MNKVTFYPEDKLNSWLKETANKKNKSVNKLVVYALELYKQREGNRQFIISQRTKRVLIKGGVKYVNDKE